MTRECHVRFCERLRGQFPRPTHHFGMKAHIGVDDESGLVHSVVGTAANAADVTQVDKLLHGVESVVCADAGYTGVEKRSEHAGREVIWQVAARRSTYRKLGKNSPLYKAKRKIEKAKAQVRAKVEHPFRVIKRQFGYVKVRFRGLAKNTAQLITLFALSNLWMARRHLIDTAGEVRLYVGNGRCEMLATAKKGEMSGLSVRFLIDCPLSKSARAEVDAKYPATSDLP